MSHLQPKHPDPIASYARSALSLADGDVARAAALLATRVRKEPALRKALLDPLIDGACADIVRALLRGDRGRLWEQPRLDVTPADRVRALGSSNLLLFPLPGGKLLGEATRAEIAAAAEFYARQAQDMATKARWLQLAAQHLPDGKIARDVLTADRLRELQKEAANG